MTTKEIEQEKYEFPDRYPEGQVTYPLCIEVLVRKKDLPMMTGTDCDRAWVDIDYHIVPRKGDKFCLGCAAPKVRRVLHYGGLDGFDHGWTDIRLKVSLKEMRILQEAVAKGEKRETWHFERCRV